mmetsp:Transcript_15406/g.22571  ORF Transcript_15406/g.22571 Transcript_15406/m.22571 type:complete len:103 (+) Transcript_15406:246-554(+)
MQDEAAVQDAEDVPPHSVLSDLLEPGASVGEGSHVDAAEEDSVHMDMVGEDSIPAEESAFVDLGGDGAVDGRLVRGPVEVAFGGWDPFLPEMGIRYGSFQLP